MVFDVFKLEMISCIEKVIYGFEILRCTPPQKTWEQQSLSELNDNTIAQLHYIFDREISAPLGVFVNIERRQIRDKSFIDSIGLVLNRIVDKGQKVVFEVTERDCCKTDDLLNLISLKKMYNIKLAADDVISIDDVRKREIDAGVYDYIKMEPFYLEGANGMKKPFDPQTHKWMSELTNEFGSEFIAEKIEYQQDLTSASLYPFSYFQGFLLKGAICEK